MNKMLFRVFILFFAAIIIIGCGESGDSSTDNSSSSFSGNSSSSLGDNSSSSLSGNSSSSSVEQENGVCYTTDIYEGADFSLCLKYKTTTLVNNAYCKYVESIQGHSYEWLRACPEGYKFMCEKERTTYYVYGAFSTNFSCDLINEN